MARLERITTTFSEEEVKDLLLSVMEDEIGDVYFDLCDSDFEMIVNSDKSITMRLIE